MLHIAGMIHPLDFFILMDRYKYQGRKSWDLIVYDIPNSFHMIHR